MLLGESTDWFDHELAERLGKFVWEIRQMPNAEYVGWQVRWQLEQQQRQLAARHQAANRRR